MRNPTRIAATLFAALTLATAVAPAAGASTTTAAPASAALAQALNGGSAPVNTSRRCRDFRLRLHHRYCFRYFDYTRGAEGHGR